MAELTESTVDLTDTTSLIKKGGVGHVAIQHKLDAILENKVGVGFFHVLLTVVTGWALASDSVEVQCISFVTPKLANETTSLRPTKVQEGLLDAIIFLGMMVGGYVWGSFSDAVGRRSCLITSLVVNGTFGFVSAFSPNYASFLVFRFFSGVGVGGSLPITFSYFSEFFSRKNQAPFIIVMAAFWSVGQFYTTLMAWAIIEPLEGVIHVPLGTITLKSWRVYIMLCTFPSISAALLFVALPESPGFLFEKRKYERLVKVLRGIQWINGLVSRKQQPKITIESFLDNIEQEPSENHSRSMIAKVLLLLQTSKILFGPKFLRATLAMIFIWFTLSFGYYGLLLWFPEYFKCVNEITYNCTFGLEDSCAADTENSIPCQVGGNVYLDSLYIAASGIPSILLAIFLVNLIGPRILLGVSMAISALSTLLIWIVPKSEVAIVVLSCVFNALSTVGWNALDVLGTSELFPVNVRSTAFGIQAVFGRLGAITGNLAFGRLISVGQFVPILLVSALLLAGALATIVLPSTSKKRRSNFCVRALRACCHRVRGRILHVN